MSYERRIQNVLTKYTKERVSHITNRTNPSPDIKEFKNAINDYIAHLVNQPQSRMGRVANRLGMYRGERVSINRSRSPNNQGIQPKSFFRNPFKRNVKPNNNQGRLPRKFFRNPFKRNVKPNQGRLPRNQFKRNVKPNNNQNRHSKTSVRSNQPAILNNMNKQYLGMLKSYGLKPNNASALNNKYRSVKLRTAYIGNKPTQLIEIFRQLNPGIEPPKNKRGRGEVLFGMAGKKAINQPIQQIFYKNNAIKNEFNKLWKSKYQNKNIPKNYNAQKQIIQNSLNQTSPLSLKRHGMFRNPKYVAERILSRYNKKQKYNRQSGLPV